jgi:signal transduction histidine kinase/ActR/RegA family two-component response regulator
MSPRGVPPQTVRLRWLLAGLIAGALVPLALLAALTVADVAGDERRATQRRLSEGARSLADALDQEMTGTLRALAALAASERLEKGDLAGFAHEAARVEASQPTWLAVLLITPEGMRVADTRLSGPMRPTPTLEPESLRTVVETGRPAVGSLVRNPREGRWTFALRVPVVQQGKVRWVLSAILSADAIGAIVAARAGSEGEWTRTVVDLGGRVVARSRAPERFVGELATASFLTGTRAEAQGVYRDVTLEGERAYVAFAHAQVSGWTTAVVAPRALLDAPLRGSLLTTAGFGLALLVLGAAGAALLSRRFSRAIDSAASGAEALARGERPVVDAGGITEVAQLRDALLRSSELLAARRRERDEHLARAETARAEAEAASRTKDEFLAMLGHELRNPLSPIVTALHLLEQRDLADTREHAIIRRQVKHLVRLVDDLLDVSRITRGKVTLHLEIVDVATVVAKAVEIASDLLEQRRHRLVVDVPPGLLVSGDPVRLAQVVANLLTNAARYTPPGGNVEVRAAREGDRIRLAVKDDGRGLDPELLPTVFDAFVQAPRTPDRQEGGLGLGLALVKSLVALHGGKVEALSEGAGRGSTFVVELPAAQRDVATAPAEQPPVVTRPRTPLRVLVVDDNADAAALLAEVLQAAGHAVEIAGDGPTALELATLVPPDVAVLDVGLPVMDGYELAERLRERLGAHAPEIVGVSGYGQPGDHERSRAAGFRRHLVKPADPTVILDELDRIAAERRPPARAQPA